MSSYLFADEMLQFALNTVVSFLLFSLLTEACLWLFRIRHSRLRACFRLLPILRLALEPFLPSLINLNIFSCSHPVQRFLFQKLSEATQYELSLHELKTVSGSLLLKVPLPLIYLGIASVVMISLYRIGTLAWQCFCSRREIKKIRQGAVMDPRPIRNAKLRQRLEMHRTKIVLSREVDVPLAGWGNCIIVPEALAKTLSQSEFEAVLSHELAHHRWRDTLVRVASHVVAAIYWWVPMKTWLHKLEDEQELACDASVHEYALDGYDLATALKKTVQGQHKSHHPCATFVCRTTTRRQALFVRLRAVLTLVRRQNKTSAVAGAILLLGLALTIGFAIC